MTHSLREQIERGLQPGNGVWGLETNKQFALRLVLEALEQCAVVCDELDETQDHACSIAAERIRAFAAQLTPGQELPAARTCGKTPTSTEGEGTTEEPVSTPMQGEVRTVPASGSPNAQTERRKVQKNLYRRVFLNDRRKANAQAPSPRGK